MLRSYVARFIFKIILQLDWKIKHWNNKSQQIIGGYVEENPEINPTSANLVLELAHEITSTGAEFILMVARLFENEF